ncbi:MAG: hypothetical protein GY737_14025 [Desulfobacteraceae bacterium]|nr:hypothetical protein [Desulfobacteraceae bacterium]
MMETHPVQTKANGRKGQGRISKAVTMKAYEVYCHVFSEQEAMVTGGCRGGFSSGELIAFLYARSFPKEEWKDRVAEVFRDMEEI